MLFLVSEIAALSRRSILIFPLLPDIERFQTSPQMIPLIADLKRFQTSHMHLYLSIYLTIHPHRMLRSLYSHQHSSTSSLSHPVSMSAHIALTKSIIVPLIQKRCLTRLAPTSRALRSRCRRGSSSIRSSIAACRFWYGLTGSALSVSSTTMERSGSRCE